jgi:hypothetical protein
MASTHFSNLAQSIRELRRVYLDGALSIAAPNPDHQELARGFLMLAHAELEYFVEEALRELAQHSFSGAVSGNFGRTAIALMAFSGLEPLHGGTALSIGKKKPRQIATRFGEAHAALVLKLDKNCGVREKHLAAMAVPLGLNASSIDNTWLNELDAFCSARGAFAHTSRTSKRGSHLAANPQDIWAKCERIVWTNPVLSTPGIISSFESLDDWIETEKTALGPTVAVASWRLRLSHLMSILIARRGRKGQLEDDDD